VAKTEIGSLLDAARSVASQYIEIYAGGEIVTMPAPRIVGPGRCTDITGVTRKVFLAAFDNAIVRSRFDGIEVGGRMLFDYQGREAQRIAAECLPDKFWSDGERIFALHEPLNDQVLEIPEALTLIGNNSPNFGHWIMEHLLQWATVENRAELQHVPILIDGDLHASHRRALEYFLQGRAPVIVLPKDSAARVERLWTVSNWIYIPIYWRDEDAIHREFIVWPAQEVASRYRSLAARIDDEAVTSSLPSFVFFSRKKTRHRKLVNIDEIEDLARGRGFAIFHPEDLDFTEQLRIVRAASHVMGPEGSAFFLAFFAKAGTKLCCFDHPFVEKVGFAEALYRALAMDLVLVTGECVRKDEQFSRFSDYRIDPSDVERILNDWVLPSAAEPRIA